MFVGSNGQGKTNLVESIGYLAYQSSHRVTQDVAVVQHGHDVATIRAVVNHDDRRVSLGFEVAAKGSNRAIVNGAKTPVGQLAGWLRAVFFTPEDLGLIRGEPSGRRRFLDQIAMTAGASTAATIAEYDRVVRQRNALLKNHRGRPNEAARNALASWNDQFVELAASYTTLRLSVLDQLRPLVAESYRTIAGDHLVDVSLDWPLASQQVPEQAIVEHYQSELGERAADEWERGVSLVGPHRHDMAITLNDLPARSHSSQGEAWSLALALRVAQADLYRRDSNSGDPVMILDDVFAELDQRRRKTLTTLVAGYEQVLVTAAVWEDVPETFGQHVFDVLVGEVTRRGTARLSDPER